MNTDKFIEFLHKIRKFCGIETYEERVARYINDMNDENVHTARFGRMQLGKINKPRAVPLLIDALKNGTPYCRREAAELLCWAEDKKTAVPALIEAAQKENDPVILREILATLVTLRDERAIPVLINKINAGDEWFRISVIRFFGETKDERTIDALIYLFKNDFDDGTRREAAEVLAKFGKLAMPKLIDALDKELDEDVDDVVMQHSVRGIIVSIGEKAVPFLIEIINEGKRDLQEDAIWLLGEIEDERAVDPLVDALEQNKDSESDIIRALGKIIPAIKSMERLDRIKIAIRTDIERLDKDATGYRTLRQGYIDLFKAVNQRRNELLTIDIVLDNKPKPPKKPDRSGTYRIQRSMLRA